MPNFLRSTSRGKCYFFFATLIFHFLPLAANGFAISKRLSQGTRVAPLCSLTNPTTETLHLCLIASNLVILPGEQTTFYSKEVSLLEDCLEDHEGIFAMGTLAPKALSDDGDDLLRVSSLCRIVHLNPDSDGVFVTVRAIGRVRLESLEKVYPFMKVYCSLMSEDHGDLAKGNLVADNIEIFMRKLTRSEENLKIGCRSEDETSLLQRYKQAYGQALESDTTQYELRTIQLLTAISWAVFTALDDPEFQHYRFRALDWDNLYERLKLAQYMLREKELRLRGISMKLESPTQNKVWSSDDTFR